MEKDWNDKWIGLILEDIYAMSCSFEKCCFSFATKSCNFVSHSLAQVAARCYKETSWRTSFPVWLMNAAREDMLSSRSSWCSTSFGEWNIFPALEKKKKNSISCYKYRYHFLGPCYNMNRENGEVCPWHPLPLVQFDQGLLETQNHSSSSWIPKIWDCITI